MLTQDPIGLAGGVNLYAYAGSNPIAWSDPFGLVDVNGDPAAMKAYDDGKQALSGCAAGKGCTAAEAADAAAGLETLARAENDQNVHIHLQLGPTVTGQSASAVDFTGQVGTIVTIDPSHSDFTTSAKYTVAGVAVHEVHKQYSKNVLFGATRPNTGQHDYVHGNAVRYGEDPVYLGSNLLSRTARTPGCNVNAKDPGTFKAGRVCF